MSKLLKNTSLYTLGNILPQAAGFFLLPIYAEYLTPSDYGIVSSMQVMSSIVVVFFTLAIDRSLFRLYYDYKTEAEKKDFFGSITVLVLGLSSIMLAILFLANSFVGLIFKSVDFYPYYAYTLLGAFFSVFSIIPKVYYQIKEKANIFILISIGQFVLNTGLVIWFLIYNEEGAFGMIKGRMLGNLIFLPLMIYLLSTIINFTINKNIIKEGLKFSLPLIPNIIIAWILNLSDRIFIERYFTLTEVGIYSLGYKIAGVMNLVAASFKKAYNPLFYKLANSQNQIQANKKLYTYNKLFSGIIFLGLFFISLFAKEIITSLFNESYQEAYLVIPLIALSYLISQNSGLFNLMLYQEKAVKKLMFVSIIAGVLNLALNYLLIPIHGIYGAAFATILSFLLMFILSWQMAKKAYYIPFNWSQQISLLVLGINVWFLFFFLELEFFSAIILKFFCFSLLCLTLLIFNKDVLRSYKWKVALKF